MTAKLISIIIPVHNGEKYLTHLINKIIKNTKSPIEILIGNDASNDQTFNILEQMKVNPLIKVFHSNLNIGAGAMRNHLMAQAKGKYIAIQDVDDDFKEDRFDKLCSFLDNNPLIEVVGSQCILQDPSTHVKWGKISPRTQPTIIDWFLQKSMVHASIMIRKSTITKKTYHTNLRTGEDYYFLTSLYWNNVKFFNIEDSLYIYNISKLDLLTRTRTRFWDIIKSIFQISKLFPFGTRILFIILNLTKIFYSMLRGAGSTMLSN